MNDDVPNWVKAVVVVCALWVVPLLLWAIMVGCKCGGPR